MVLQSGGPALSCRGSYVCSENKHADQLHGDHAAVSAPLFLHMQKVGFLMTKVQVKLVCNLYFEFPLDVIKWLDIEMEAKVQFILFLFHDYILNRVSCNIQNEIPISIDDDK